MKLFVAVTDNEWFRFLRDRKPDEVNFWRPKSDKRFRALEPGEPLLFKLHSPENYIVGGGFFAHFSVLPVSLAWEAFGEKNGAASLAEMRSRIERYRREPVRPHEDYRIGCIVLTEPFFLEDHEWIPAPQDFSRNIVSGKGYDMLSGTGRRLWESVQQALASRDLHVAEPTVGMVEVVAQRRLGQGAFRVLVTDIYGRRCAVTGAKALPALDAAHILPVAEGGTHRPDNGILLRSDIHRLFDKGYVTIGPDYRFRASSALKRDFDNGEEYLALDRQQISLPGVPELRPSREFLEWHADTVFRG